MPIRATTDRRAAYFSAARARSGRARRLLHVWSLTTVATGQPGYYEELAAARAGPATTIPVTDAVPDWAERVAAARDRRGRTERPVNVIQNVHFRRHLVESSNGCPREERLPAADISADNRGSLIQDAGPGGTRTPGIAG